LEREDLDSSQHFLAVDQNSISSTLCSSRDYAEVGVEGIIVHENTKHEVTALLTQDSTKKHYQLCFSAHSHQHQFKLSLSTSQPGDCDMILSTDHPFPSEPDHWQWKSTERGPDSIILPSYSNEFLTSKTQSLFITVTLKPDDFSSSPPSISTVCTLSLEVATFSNDALLKRVGLRGGKRILPHELRRIIHG